MSLIYLLLVVTVVGRYSAQQIASTERRFQCCIFNMYAQTGVTPVLHTCFIKFPHSFAQTSVMAVFDLDNSCAGALENDEDGKIIKSSLNIKVRSYTYQLSTAYAVALNPITCRDIIDAVAKSVHIQ